ncbi:MFS transporter [Effusibacillus lacus]|uniref:MFS transporter n=1 Tax=Effusibacillus lacus TaxID=1348429 RepID=A0A292YLY1_9BACL|nr:MFS transporter [Effusibacillus lacus]TCS73603.1 MFS transporter [Effusibacillus lacus]GAX89505.1 MFS transporter [Effusibacillus lacus]
MQSTIPHTLSTHLRIFLWIQLFVSTASSLSGLFVNVFLWKVNQDLLTIAYFNMTLSASIMLMMFPAGWIGRRLHSVWCLRMAMGMFAFFYFLIAYWQERAGDHFILLGILHGSAIAFFALATHVISYDHSQSGNRSRYFGWYSFVSTMGNMAPPLLSGWIITRFDTIAGYRTIFLISLVLFAAACLLSVFLPGRGQKTKGSLLSVMKNGGDDWRNVQLANGVYGLHDGVMWFLLQLVAFWILKDEFQMGIYTTAASLLSLFAAVYVGKRVQPHNRIRYFLAGAIGVGLGHLILAFHFNVAGFTLYTLWVTVFANFYSIPYNSITFEVISRDPQAQERRVDYIVSREIPIGLGRLLSVAAFVALHDHFQNQTAVQVTIGVLGLLYLICWRLMARIRLETEPVTHAKTDSVDM